jgi:histidine triad (HIT) family protein
MIQGTIDVKIIHQDEHLFVIRDIAPKAPTHLLIIPVQHIDGVQGVGPNHDVALSRIFTVAREMAIKEGVATTGYRLVVNHGSNAGQEIPHLHVHLLGGTRLANIN